MSKRGGSKVGNMRRECPCCAAGNKKEDRKWFFNRLKQVYQKEIEQQFHESVNDQDADHHDGIEFLRDIEYWIEWGDGGSCPLPAVEDDGDPS